MDKNEVVKFFYISKASLIPNWFDYKRTRRCITQQYMFLFHTGSIKSGPISLRRKVECSLETGFRRDEAMPMPSLFTDRKYWERPARSYASKLSRKARKLSAIEAVRFNCLSRSRSSIVSRIRFTVVMSASGKRSARIVNVLSILI